MNGFVLLSASTFIYFTYQILDDALCDATHWAGLQRDPNKQFRYAQFIEHFYHVLDVPKIEEVAVQTGRQCLLRCVKDDRCFSANTGAFHLPNGNISCDLLPTDKYNASEKFKANHTFHHYSIMSPCESFPCQHGGTCQALYEVDDYRCTCKQNYIGKYCEDGQSYSSCKEIYKNHKENKAYPLQTDSGKVPVYCHMTSSGLGACGGGGWTLVMKIDGTKPTFHYDSKFWSNKIDFNPLGGKTGLDHHETKLPTYWNTSFNKICLGMRIGHHTNFIAINKPANSLYSLIADGQYRVTSLGRNTWKSLIGSQASLQYHCNKEGFNAVGNDYLNSRARIGILGNNENDCDECDSRIGFGTGGDPDNSSTCGNEAVYFPDNGNKYIKALGYILVQ